MQAVEHRYIRRVLQTVNGNKTLAAKLLGFDRRTMYRKLAVMPKDHGMVEQTSHAGELPWADASGGMTVAGEARALD